MPRTLRTVASLTVAIAIVSAAACNKADDSTTQTTTTTTTPAPAPPPAEERFGATMDGLSERPTTLNTGATGTAEFTFTSSGTISYTISVTGLSSNPTAAHIHGPADLNASAGPVVPFDSLPKLTSGTIASGTIDAARMQGNGISLDSLKAMIRNGMAYVNVHTVSHKDGEIRGQITKR